MFFYLEENKKRNPYYNLAREEAIALHMKDFNIQAGLRFWRNPDSIILGLSDSLLHNVNLTIIENWKQVFSNLCITKKHFADMIYIARRSSGGGTVFHSFEENLNFSFFVDKDLKPELNSITNSYQIFLGFIKEALRYQKIFVEFKGQSDLSLEKEKNFLKISGNSQFRKKNIIVHHGTLILNEKLIQKVENFLQHPPQEPEYRQKRKHSNFLKSLPQEFNLKQFQQDLKNIYLNYLSISIVNVPKSFWRKVALTTKELQKTKYQNKQFILKETAFDLP